MKKRILSLFMALALALCLCACAKTEPTLSRGSVSGNTYKNDFAGITFVLPEGWRFLSEEELTENNSVLENRDEDGKLVACYDAMATDDGFTTVLFSYEDTAYHNGEALSVEEYLETSKELLVEQFESAYDGVSAEILESGSGDAFPYLHIAVDVGGTMIYSDLIVKQIGNVMATITVGALDEAAIEAVFSGLTL